MAFQLLSDGEVANNSSLSNSVFLYGLQPRTQRQHYQSIKASHSEHDIREKRPCVNTVYCSFG